MAKDTSTLSLPKTRRVGTIAYMAPEIVDSTGVYDGAPVDVWSLGVMLYVMVYCNYPFGHDGAGGESTRKVLERIRGAQVRKTFKLAQKDVPSWPRSWADSSLLQLYSHRKGWANLHLLGQPDPSLAISSSSRSSRRFPRS